MRDENKHSKKLILLSIGVVMLLPAFNVSFIQQGNIIDKVFFFIALIGYIFIIISTILGYKEKYLKKEK